MKIVNDFGTAFKPVINFGCVKCECAFHADSRDYIAESITEEKENIRVVSVCPMCGTYCKRTLPKSRFIKKDEEKE